MKHLWQLERCFMKDLLAALPEPKPAKTTVATLIKRMIDKKMVGYRTYGNSREYYPLLSKSEYFGKKVKGMITDFFDDSPASFASFFTAEAKFSKEQLEELREIINQQIKEEE